MNLLGSALTPSEFARRKPSTTLGLSITVIMPTGTYDRKEFINIGSNRWTFKPESASNSRWESGSPIYRRGFGSSATTPTISEGGASASARSTFSSFTPVTRFVKTSGSRSMRTITRAVRPRPVGEPRSIHSQTRDTGDVFAPVGSGLSTKVSWSRWLSGRFGQRFSTIGFALQYLWFNSR